VPGYELVAEISRTPRAVVYRARQQPFGREVAIKVFLDSAIWESNRIAIAALAGHPGVVAVHEFGVLGSGEPFVAMEWLEPTPLADRADVISWSDARPIAATLTELASYAQSQDVPAIAFEAEHILLSAYREPKWTGRHVRASVPGHLAALLGALAQEAPGEVRKAIADYAVGGLALGDLLRAVGGVVPATLCSGAIADPGEPTVRVALPVRRRRARWTAGVTLVGGLSVVVLGATLAAESASHPKPVVATNTSVADPAKLGDVLFRDDLAQSGAFTAYRQGAEQSSFEGERLHITLQPGKTRAVARSASWTAPEALSRVSVSVDVRYETPTDGAGGPTCHSQDNSFYAGTLTADGDWEISFSGTPGGVASGHLPLAGRDAKVRLDCLVEGDTARLALWVDDRLAGQGAGAAHSPLRRAGLMVRGAYETVEISFAAFEVRSPL